MALTTERVLAERVARKKDAAASRLKRVKNLTAEIERYLAEDVSGLALGEAGRLIEAATDLVQVLAAVETLEFLKKDLEVLA